MAAILFYVTKYMLLDKALWIRHAFMYRMIQSNYIGHLLISYQVSRICA